MELTQAEPSPETRQLQFEQGVAISLHLWLSLTVAVQNGLGGPDSEDKRDWFAGAIVDMFPSFVDLAKPRKPGQKQPPADPDPEDVEATLLQVMWDEFETNVDDDSELEVAERIAKVRTQCAAGDFEFVEELRRKWLATKGKTVKVQEVDAGDQETDWESDGDDDDEDDDVEMDEAPALVSVPKEKPPPEVDEDGFTKVIRKKR
ncbi:hypothetical protein Daesc_002446 [Daldinia eschscholtzii]|uniref:Pre-rRNA-processing protein TSR2 n=1 Tax=Daldinia eschscholtzii TaxID=292717 RepID=A0AAX6MWW8_9PEZI